LKHLIEFIVNKQGLVMSSRHVGEHVNDPLPADRQITSWLTSASLFPLPCVYTTPGTDVVSSLQC